MKTLKWNRDQVIQHLRRDIWRYVTQASNRYHPALGNEGERLLLCASALLQMPAAEVRFLAQLEFILSEPVHELLQQMPALIRRLTTTTAAETELSVERIRGSIRWSETYAQRAAVGTPHLFVTTPTYRAFDTDENHVLAFALFAIAEFGKRTGWHRVNTEGPARDVQNRVAEATRWLQARQFSGLPILPPSPTTISRVRAGRARRRYQSALDVVSLYQRYIARLDRRAIRYALENHALIVSRDSVLLELRCAFDMIRTLRKLGWQSPPTGLLSPPAIFQGNRNGATLELTFQQCPHELSVDSLYRDTQLAHAFSNRSGLIPDLALKIKKGGVTRWLLVEVKGGYKRSVTDSARAAVRDLFAYRRAFSKVLCQQEGPYGLGYAWGSGLHPSADGDVTLCTPDTLADALAKAIP